MSEEEESNYRINIKQNAKGYAYFEVTIRAKTEQEARERLDQAINVAVIKQQQINASQLIRESA